jgi:glucosamine--fructose-6-phosphate aminotransferase (isomerizing)
MIERGFPVFLFMPAGKAFNELKRLASRLRRLSAETVAFCPAGPKLPPVTRALGMPGGIAEIYTPIPYIVPAQLFAGLLAEIKGLDPDRPRSLNIVTRTL